MVCPIEYVDQVNAATNCPFDAGNAPVGIWGRNGLGNVFLKEPNFSFHYFNADGGYYYQQASSPDQQGHSVYYSPPGDRYYNPSVGEKHEGSYFVGLYWETSKEKICYNNSEGIGSLTFRKHVEPEGLPRHRVALYYNSAGMQRVVEVNERGVYSGQDQKLLAEIRFWLANNLPQGYLDGPRLVDDVPPRARLISPPPDDGDDASQHSHQSRPSSPGGSEPRDAPPSSNDKRASRTSRPSSPNVKTEENPELSELNRGESASRSSNPQIKEEPSEDEGGRIEDLPESSSSARACLSKLFAARKTPEVRGSRITKRSSSEESPSKRAILLRPESALRASQESPDHD